MRTLINRLKLAKADYGWDLGDICIAQCGTILSRMTNNHNGKSRMALATATPAQSNLGLGFQQYFNDLPQEVAGDMGQSQYLNPQMGDLCMCNFSSSILHVLEARSLLPRHAIESSLEAPQLQHLRDMNPTN